MTYSYYLTEKRGQKLYGLAIWTPDTNQTCLSIAEDCFRMHGLKLGWTQHDSIIKQKNWQGLIPSALCLYTSVADVRKWSHMDMAKHYKHNYKMDYNEFCERQSGIKDVSKEEWSNL